MWSYSNDWYDSLQNVGNIQFLGYQDLVSLFPTICYTLDKPSCFQLSVKMVNNQYPSNLKDYQKLSETLHWLYLETDTE